MRAKENPVHAKKAACDISSQAALPSKRAFIQISPRPLLGSGS